MSEALIPIEALKLCSRDFCTLEEMLSDAFASHDPSLGHRLEHRLNRFLSNYGSPGVAKVVRDLRENKGIRLRNLERALEVNRVVVSGSISLKHILRGNFTSEREMESSITIRIQF